MEREKESKKQEKDAIVSNMEGLMEEELICSICSELFIQVTMDTGSYG